MGMTKVCSCRYCKDKYIHFYYEPDFKIPSSSPNQKSKRKVLSNNKNPNPDPLNWTILEMKQFRNAYVLKVRYPNCSNFEGIKIMVYKGVFKPTEFLDPHFFEDENSPIARFKPNKEGIKLAFDLASRI